MKIYHNFSKKRMVFMASTLRLRIFFCEIILYSFIFAKCYDLISLTVYLCSIFQ